MRGPPSANEYGGHGPVHSSVRPGGRAGARGTRSVKAATPPRSTRYAARRSSRAVLEHARAGERGERLVQRAAARVRRPSRRCTRGRWRSARARPRARARARAATSSTAPRTRSRPACELAVRARRPRCAAAASSATRVPKRTGSRSRSSISASSSASRRHSTSAMTCLVLDGAHSTREARRCARARSGGPGGVASSVIAISSIIAAGRFSSAVATELTSARRPT